MDFTKANRYGEEFAKPQYGPGPVWIVSRDPKGKGRLGVWTGVPEKQSFADLIMETFMSNTIVYAKDFNSANEAKFKKAFESQAKYLRREYKPVQNSWQKPKEQITGKGRDEKDDAIICLGIILDGWKQLTEDPSSEFMQTARRNNWLTFTE